MSSRAGDRKEAFAPVVDSHTRLLILGSLPGDASLKAAQYYGHPRNGFWRLIGGVMGQDLAALAYAQRLGVLKSAGIGLWDVIASAERSGSLDTAIRAPQAADLRGLVASLPALRAIAFNGGKASSSGRHILTGIVGLDMIDLPSSSPAHARPLSEKAAAWSILRSYLPDAPPDRP